MIYYFSLFLIFWVGWLSFFSVPWVLAEYTKHLFGYLLLGVWLGQHIQDGFIETHGTSSVVSGMPAGWFGLFLSHHSVILPIAFLVYGWIPKEWKWKLLSLIRKGHAPELTRYHFCLFLLVKTSHKTSNNSGEAK